MQNIQEGFFSPELKALEHIQPIADALPYIFSITLPNGSTHFLNKKWFDYTGLFKDFFSSNDWIDVVHHEDLENFVRLRKVYRALGQPFEGEIRLRRFDGAYKWFLAKSQPVKNESGKPIYWVGTATEIAPLKKTEIILNEQNNLHALLMQIPAAICILRGPQLTFEFANPTYRKIVGAHRKLKDRSVFDVLPELDGFIKNILLEVLRTGKRYTGHEMPVSLNWDGTGKAYEKYFNFVYEPLKNEQKADGLIIFAYEVTQLVMSRRASESSTERLRRALEAGQMISWEWNFHSEGVWQEEDLASILLGDSIKTIHVEDVSIVKENIDNALKETGKCDVEYRVLWPDQSIHWCLTKATVYREAATGKATSIAGCTLDITHTKELELELREALVARDNLISICSHELKTPLTALKIQVQLMERGFEMNDPSVLSPTRVQKLVHHSNTSVERLTRLVDDMLDISRINSGKLEIVLENFDLSELTEEVVDRFKNQFELKNCEIFLNLAESVMVSLDRYRIDQVLTNLITNVLKYAAGTPVTIQVSQYQDEAFISVRDEGPGIALEDQLRIFERFERANSIDHASGLGLGLYIVREIVEAHQGKIQVISQPEKGAEFIITLPIVRR